MDCQSRPRDQDGTFHQPEELCIATMYPRVCATARRPLDQEWVSKSPRREHSARAGDPRDAALVPWCTGQVTLGKFPYLLGSDFSSRRLRQQTREDLVLRSPWSSET